MVQVTKQEAGEILKDYLKGHGISQAFVARKMGITRQTFNAYVNGNYKFTADFAISAADALGISPDIFLKKNYRKSVEKEKDNGRTNQSSSQK